MVKKEIVFRIIVPLLSIAISLGVLELFARIYLVALKEPKTQYDFRKNRPAPYKNAPYFSEKFIWESFHQPSRWLYPKGTRLIIPGDYHGTFFNIKNGIRVTTSQPVSYQNAVYLFGGSTVYSSEVPDNLTIASQLQLLFNSKYKNKYIVQNYGTTTVTISQELERLKTIQLKPNDIVVFYDGVNDIYQGLLYANPKETMIEMNRRTVNEMNVFRKLEFDIYNHWSEESSLVQLCCDPTNRSFPQHLADARLVNSLLRSLESRYRQTIKDSASQVFKSRAKFYHFLQPHLFADNILSEYEQQLSQNPYIVLRGVRESFAKGYPILKAVIRKLDQDSSFDLTESLNERPDRTEYFFDGCHVNHEANRIIASKIFEQIDKDLKIEGEN
jgi:lysophospholipase L1-like esterase